MNNNLKYIKVGNIVDSDEMITIQHCFKSFDAGYECGMKDSTIELEYQYELLKRLEEYYWEVYNDKDKIYHTELEEHGDVESYINGINLGKSCAYHCIWNNLYDELNSVCRKLGKEVIKR